MTAVTLTERRKADRAIMALQVVDLASEYGLAAWHRPEQPGTRHTSVDLAGPHGLKLTVHFYGITPFKAADTYVLSWHGTEDGWRLNPGTFGNVNSYHGHKATDVAHGFDALIAMLARRQASMADGSAFIQEGT